MAVSYVYIAKDGLECYNISEGKSKGGMTMTKKNFIILLLLAFSGAFWWAGGNVVISSYLPAASHFTASPTLHNTVTLYDHVYRIVRLKNAVATKIDHKNYVKLADIPLTFQQALIAVEDNRFYHHYGFDVEGILRATLVNMQTGSYTEGGSTITQQLVKNLFLNQEKSFTRKIEEFVLAVDMELCYSKAEILEMYVNTIYFGSGAYGINAACQTYFAKNPADLTLAESALLAGVPNAPSLYSPFVDFAAAKQRQAVVLSLMAKNNYIAPGLAAEAQEAPLRLVRK
jgi:penicillin-binding protein 1A